jgi:hypothetical protein
MSGSWPSVKKEKAKDAHCVSSFFSGQLMLITTYFIWFISIILNNQQPVKFFLKIALFFLLWGGKEPPSVYLAPQ